MEEKIEMRKCAGCGKEQNKELFKKIAFRPGEFSYCIYCDECRYNGTAYGFESIKKEEDDEKKGGD